MIATRISPRRKPRQGREIIADYKAFIAEQPCFVCFSWGLRQTSRTEVAHLGPRGLGQKCSDRETGPLCGEHHRTGPCSHHRLGVKFWDYFGLRRDETIALYQRKYEAQGGTLTVHPPDTQVKW